jgi:hypothetical protein
MNKIVVERERWGSSRPSRKWGKRLAYVPGCDYEDEPKKVSSSRDRQYVCPRDFTDVLTPVKGFLWKNIGRPWDKVYGELRSGLDVRKVTGRHVFQHLERMVELNCFEDENHQIQYLDESRHWRRPGVEGFYVHPRTRTLSYAPHTSKAEAQRKSLDRRPIEGFWIDDTRAYRIVNGIWYVVNHKIVHVSRKAASFPEAWDAVQHAKVRLHTGNNFIGIQKKQCNREQIAEVQKLIAEWERSLRQRSFRLRRELRAILGPCPVCRWNCSGHSGICWSVF